MLSQFVILFDFLKFFLTTVWFTDILRQHKKPLKFVDDVPWIDLKSDSNIRR